MIEIIAEIGVNHNGDFEQALKMIIAAKYAGCDTVKFQLFHGDRYPELQLSADQLSDLRQYTLAEELKFLCTPDDVDDARAIKTMGCDRIKIGSSNVTNIPLLEEVSRLEVDVLLSSGACSRDEVAAACRAVCRHQTINRGVTVLHCLSAYPAPIGELNLRFFEELIQTDYGGGMPYVYGVGYSDHTIGSDYQSALVALGLGARVFEKHLTLGHWMRGPDHKMSADMHEMKVYVGELRRYAAALGDGRKRVMPSEMLNRKEYERFVEAQYANRAAV